MFACLFQKQEMCLFLILKWFFKRVTNQYFLSFVSSEMELTKILFVALVAVMRSTTSATTTTNSSSTISHTEMLVKVLIAPRVINVTAQVTC